jgi:hypothetical protein
MAMKAMKKYQLKIIEGIGGNGESGINNEKR